MRRLLTLLREEANNIVYGARLCKVITHVYAPLSPDPTGKNTTELVWLLRLWYSNTYMMLSTYVMLSFAPTAPVLFFLHVTLTLTSVSTDEEKMTEQVIATLVPATSEPPEGVTVIGTAGCVTTERK